MPSGEKSLPCAQLWKDLAQSGGLSGLDDNQDLKLATARDRSHYGHMAARLNLTLLCLLAPFGSGADTLEVYGSLTGKTVLMPTALPRLPDAIVADLPTDKTNAIARIEKVLSEQGLEVVQDGPHFVRVFPKEARDSLTNSPLRGAELALRSDSQGFGNGGIDFKQAES